MVTVSGYKVRQNKDGDEFIALELTGSVELIQSTQTGKYYATVRKVSMPSTLDETVAKLSVGQQMQGDIVRVPCDSYTYTVKRTGEKISLAYSYAYQPAGSNEVVGHGEVEIEEPRSSPSKANSAGISSAASRNRRLMS